MDKVDLDDLEEQSFIAVRAYARALNGRTANKIIHALRRAKAVGVYGDAGHRTRWDEFCHEWQEGPHEPFRTAWEHDLHPYLESHSSELTGEDGLLLSAAAMWEFDEAQNHAELAKCPELIQRSIMDALIKAAMARDLSRFGLR